METKVFVKFHHAADICEGLILTHRMDFAEMDKQEINVTIYKMKEKVNQERHQSEVRCCAGFSFLVIRHHYWFRVFVFPQICQLPSWGCRHH